LQIKRLIHFILMQCMQYSRGNAVLQLVEALRYMLDGRRFESQCYDWNFSLIYFFWPNYVPGIGAASNWNEYKEYFLVHSADNQLSCADCHEIWKPRPPITLRACTEIALPLYSIDTAHYVCVSTQQASVT
jgi:hypothetical protein